MKTGVVDGAMVWAEASKTFKLVEVAPHMLKGDIGTVNSKAITMNAKSWKKLPEEVQQAIAGAAPLYRDHMGKTALSVAKKSYAKFKASGGKIVQMSAAERQNWASTMPNIAKGWAAGLEKKGIPGKAILKSYMDEMRANNQAILRQWDQE